MLSEHTIETLEAVSRERALTDAESLMLEKLVRKEKVARGRTTHKWTREEDRTLRRVQYRRRGVAEFAKKIGVSEAAAWSRIQVLRYPHKRRVRPIHVEG